MSTSASPSQSLSPAFDLAAFKAAASPATVPAPRPLSIFVDVIGRGPYRIHMAAIKSDGTREDFVSNKSWETLTPSVQRLASQLQAEYRAGTLKPDPAHWQLSRPRTRTNTFNTFGASSAGGASVPFSVDQLLSNMNPGT